MLVLGIRCMTSDLCLLKREDEQPGGSVEGAKGGRISKRGKKLGHSTGHCPRNTPREEMHGFSQVQIGKGGDAKLDINAINRSLPDRPSPQDFM